MISRHGTGHSIRFFLALSYTLFVLVGLTVVGLVWFSRQEVATEDALLLQLKERARLMASIDQFETFQPHDIETPEIITALNRSLRVLYLDQDLQIKRLSDLSISEDQRLVALKLAGSALDGGYTVTQTIYPERMGGYDILYAAAPIYSPDHSPAGVVCLILPLNEFDANMNQLRLELVAFTTLLALIGLMLGFGLAAMFTRPLKRASLMAARVAGGDYETRLPLQGPNELVALSEDLNRMAADLEDQARLRSQMLANVSHELARPLGALRLGIDSLRSGAIQEPELAEDLLNEISQTLQRMNTIVEDLDLASRPVQKQVDLHLRPLPVDELMQSLRSRFRLVAEARGIQFTVDCPDSSLRIQGDDDRLHQIIGNLIDNALKFTPSGGQVGVSARGAGDFVEVDVVDTGMGIPEEDMEHIFKPFYQSQNKSMINRGMGLGLSIVDRLVRAHGGEVVLEPNTPHGTRARVWLPAAPAGAGGPL